MKLKALSKYDGDVDTRYGDCIMLYDDTSLIVYDCGHSGMRKRLRFFAKKFLIKQVSIVISHNDSDHTNGILDLMEYLYEHGYTVTVYSALYLKNTKEILDILDDKRRTSEKTKEHILEIV